MLNTQPVLLITGDHITRETIAALLPTVDITHTRDPQNIGHYWPNASAVIIGADMAREVAALNPPDRAAVYVVIPAHGPTVHLPLIRSLPASAVVMSLVDAPGWLTHRLRVVAAGGCDPNGCQHPQPCEGGQFCRCPQSTPCYPPRVAASRS